MTYNQFRRTDSQIRSGVTVNEEPTTNQRTDGGLFSRIPHLYASSEEVDKGKEVDKKRKILEEYTCLIHYLAIHSKELLKMAKTGEPLRIGTSDDGIDIPLKHRQGSVREIVSVEGEYGTIHVLLPKVT